MLLFVQLIPLSVFLLNECPLWPNRLIIDHQDYGHPLPRTNGRSSVGESIQRTAGQQCIQLKGESGAIVPVTKSICERCASANASLIGFLEDVVVHRQRAQQHRLERRSVSGDVTTIVVVTTTATIGFFYAQPARSPVLQQWTNMRIWQLQADLEHAGGALVRLEQTLHVALLISKEANEDLRTLIPLLTGGSPMTLPGSEDFERVNSTIERMRKNSVSLDDLIMKTNIDMTADIVWLEEMISRHAADDGGWYSVSIILIVTLLCSVLLFCCVALIVRRMYKSLRRNYFGALAMNRALATRRFQISLE